MLYDAYIMRADDIYQQYLMNEVSMENSHRITIDIERSTGHYDQFWFISPLELVQSANRFLIHKAMIENFVTQLKEWTTPWVKIASTHQIYLPQQRCSNLRGLSC